MLPFFFSWVMFKTSLISFIRYVVYLKIAEYGVIRDRQPLRNLVFACLTVVLLVLKHLRILFSVGLEASL